MTSSVNVKVLLDYKQYCRLKKDDASRDSCEISAKEETAEAKSPHRSTVLDESRFPILEENRNANIATERHINHPGKPLEATENLDAMAAGEENVVETPGRPEPPNLLDVVPHKKMLNAEELLQALDIKQRSENVFVLDGLEYTRDQLRWLFHAVFTPGASKAVKNEDQFIKSIKSRDLEHLIRKSSDKHDSGDVTQWWKV